MREGVRHEPIENRECTVGLPEKEDLQEEEDLQEVLKRSV